jgi:hypothetical protein
VTKYWAAEYLRQHREQLWTGCVLGWFRPEMQLAAVTLEELGLESIVKVRAWACGLGNPNVCEGADGLVSIVKVRAWARGLGNPNVCEGADGLESIVKVRAWACGLGKPRLCGYRACGDRSAGMHSRLCCGYTCANCTWLPDTCGRVASVPSVQLWCQLLHPHDAHQCQSIVVNTSS